MDSTDKDICPCSTPAGCTDAGNGPNACAPAAGTTPEAVAAPHARTRRVWVGGKDRGVDLGGGAPVRVQSMLTAPTDDPTATLAQTCALVEAGCELVRAAVPHKGCLDGFEELCATAPVPIIADIHFDYRLALEAARRGAGALRINPGNIGSWARVDAVIDSAGEAGIPIRIGVNAGSIDPALDSRDDMSLPDKMVASVSSYVEHFFDRGFHDVVVSAKAHDINVTIETYERLSKALPTVPLHLGVTEAGTPQQGSIKSALGIGTLLREGIGDTFRVSLTADPLEEIPVAWGILQALGIRRRSPELVSCPTCARCQVNMIPLAKEVEERLSRLQLPISVAVMGCVVNGPGEARGADIGVACGRGNGSIFVNGQITRRASQDEIVDALFEEIGKRFARVPSEDAAQ